MGALETVKPLAFDEAAEDARVLGRCERAVAAAGAAGAAEAEAFARASVSVTARFEKGELALTQVDEGTSLGVRVLRERRLGFASTNQGADAALERAARDAVELAGMSPPDEHNALPAARRVPAGASLVGPELCELDVPAVVALGRDLVARALRDARLALDKADVSLVRATHAVASSRGVAAAESDAVLTLSVFGMAIDGADVGGFHYCGDCARGLVGLEERVARVADEFATVALENLAPKRARSYRGPVLFAPAALLSVFVSPLVSAASAIAVQRGRSALAEKLGQRVAAPGVTLLDDPEDRELAGAARFDREGTPCARFALVEDGVLQGFLYNGYAAAVGGRASTGHATGGARSVPGVGVHALSVAPGADAALGATRDELARALGTGLVVQRFSGTVDPSSGDFSGVAKSARWVEDGRVVHAVGETLLSGNAFELLAGAVRLGARTETISGAARAPWAIVDGVEVTAG